MIALFCPHCGSSAHCGSSTLIKFGTNHSGTPRCHCCGHTFTRALKVGRQTVRAVRKGGRCA